MARKREFGLLRDRLKVAAKGRGLWLFSGALVLLIAIVAGSGFYLLRTRPATVESLEGPAFCQPCAALSRLERAMGKAVARDEEFVSSIDRRDRDQIVGEIASWQRRCSTLLCSQPPKDRLSCAAPPASLLTELATIDALSESLTRRTALCSEGGCQSAKCEQASAAQAAFAGLHKDLRTLIDHPSVLVGHRRQVSTASMFDELSMLDDTVLAAPGFVAQGRFASAEGRLLQLRDRAVGAEAASPDSAEGLLADRLEEVNASIEALAQGRRAGVTGGGLASLWRDFADASARLLVEAATLRAEMHRRADVFEAMVRPEALVLAGEESKVCEGTIRLVQATEQRLANAVSQLNLCNQRADCLREEEEGVTALTDSSSRPGAEGRAMLELLANRRESAASTLRQLTFQKDAEVALTTDLQQYFSGEAIAVHPMAETNRCLNDRGSRLALVRSADAAETKDVETHALDPADSSAWLFEAPAEAGTYRFVLHTSQSRGAGQFGASAVFAVTPPTIVGCNGFSGRWRTDFGILTVYVREGLARGTYRQDEADRAGMLVGTVEGGTLTGRWTSELGDGGAKLTLGDDGRSFTGTWSQYPERYSGAGRWEGQCLGTIGPTPAGDESPEQPQGAARQG